ncbi:hypothetical protein CHS0354_022499 [Potamilus streckersoni]|uniref:Uncharacterized protein n=1 Tax=Potamilus streckersoni TaxID=2493646 RepID=A0AAE0SY47_9BIVA|nr:hypothetical protein CHS0354_022499 [Potamilus streckersoni]
MAATLRLNCWICLFPYKKPKILSCFHSFCEACLESHISKARPNPKFQCPICRTEIDIPEGGACCLQSNFYIEIEEVIAEEKVIEEKEVVLCENCDVEQKPVATKYCNVCEQNICCDCALLHEKLKTTRSHKLVGLDHVENKICRKKLCVKHSDEFAEQYCSDCEEFVCSVCRDQYHNNHTVEDIKTTAGKRKRDIQNAVKESEIYLALTQKRLEVIQDPKSMVKSYEKKALQELEEAANRPKEQINIEVKTLSLEIAQKCENELSQLNSFEKSMTSVYENHEAIKQWVAHASDEELLAEGIMIKRKLMAINAAVPSYIPPVGLVSFSKNARINVGSLGSVLNTKTCPNVAKMEMELIDTFCLPDSRQIITILPYKEMQILIVQRNVKGLAIYHGSGLTQANMLQDLTITAVDSDTDFNMFACVSGECKLFRINRDGKVTTFCTLPIIPNLIAACPDGRVIVCGVKSDRLIVIDKNCENMKYIQKKGGPFYLPKFLAVCKRTNILATVDAIDSQSSTVELFDYRATKIT